MLVEERYNEAITSELHKLISTMAAEIYAETTKHEEIVHKGLQTVKILACGATHDTQRKTRAKDHLFVVAKNSPSEAVK